MGLKIYPSNRPLFFIKMSDISRYRRAIIVFSLAMMSASCANLPTTEAPYLSVIDISVEQATVLEQKYRIQVRVQNTNEYALTVTGLTFELELNEEPFLRGVSGREFIVPRYGDTVTEVEGVSTIFSFVRQIQALQDKTVESLDYRLSGKLSLKERMFRLPFDYQGRISLPQPAQPKNL